MIKRILWTTPLIILAMLIISAPVSADSPTTTTTGMNVGVTVDGDNSNVGLNVTGENSSVSVNGQSLNNLAKNDQLSLVAYIQSQNYTQLQDSLTALQNSTAVTQQQVDGIDTTIKDLQDSLTALESSSDTDSHNLSMTMDAVAKLITQLGDLNTSLSGLDTKSRDNNLNIGVIRRTLDSTKQDLVAVFNSLNQQLNNNVTELQNQLNNQNEAIQTSNALSRQNYDKLYDQYILLRNIGIIVGSVLAIVLAVIALKIFVFNKGK